MEANPVKFYRGISSYWRRRRYQKVEKPTPGKKAGKVVKFGTGPPARGSKRRVWKLRPLLKFRMKILNPLRLLAGVRDTYVNWMLGLTRKGLPSGPEAVWTKRIPSRRATQSSEEEHRLKMIFDIYRALVVSGEIKEENNHIDKGGHPSTSM